jgi:hypothetical protein
VRGGATERGEQVDLFRMRTTAEINSKVQTKEKSVQEAITRILLAKGWAVVRVNSGGWRDRAGRYIRTYLIPGLGSEGHPDLVAYHQSGHSRESSIDSGWCRALFIEVKGAGGRLRPSQQRFITWASSRGIPVHVFDRWEQALDLVTRIAV